MNEYLKLKKSNCKDCYKCIRNCPVKSIRVSENQAHIIAEDCILCGHCFLACPQNAKEIRNDVDVVRALIESGKPVYASLAPSFVSNYDVSAAGMAQALKKLGFAGAEETAVGATMVARQYENLVAQEKRDAIISTCCYTVILLIRKYHPELIKNLAPVVSPMQAHCRDLKERHGDIHTVFIGPCISKKKEAAEDCQGDVDCVLTFEELSIWLKDENVAVEPAASEEEPPFLARMFPTTGGILKTMTDKRPDCTYLAVDGMENCLSAIHDIEQGGLTQCFIEMSACQNSCINGPAMDRERRMPVRGYLAVSSYAGGENLELPAERLAVSSKEFTSLASRKVYLPDSAIEEVLRRMGKTKPEHELNCGSCGYNTCREKARAVIDGKADLTMCLPYLKEKAESFSDTIISHTPNAILVVNENLEVQLVNTAARGMLKIDASEIRGDQVVRYLDPTPFIDALHGAKNTYAQRKYLAEYKKHVEQTVIHDRNYHIIICIMRDITEETTQLQSRRELSRSTIEITDKVIEKQMCTVQEIASLLGETTAETQVALIKLKESLYDS